MKCYREIWKKESYYSITISSTSKHKLYVFLPLPEVHSFKKKKEVKLLNHTKFSSVMT